MDHREIRWEGVDIGFMWLKIGLVKVFCEHGNEPLGFITGTEFLD
jgi:hypothetical protein